MSHAVAAIDLDRTLVYSLRWFAQHACADDARTVEPERRRGSAVHVAAMDGLASLLATRRLIPCTSRSVTQYRRLDRGWPGPTPRVALVANGGHLMIDGVPDRAWHETIRRRISDECGELAHLEQCLGRFGPAEVVDEVLVTCRTPDAAEAQRVAARLRGEVGVERVRLFAQSSTVLAIPLAADKGTAVASLVTRLGAELAYAAGDSVLDGSMLVLADRFRAPAHAEPELLRRSGATTTAAAGPAAAVEILREALAAVSVSRRPKVCY